MFPRLQTTEALAPGVDRRCRAAWPPPPPDRDPPPDDRHHLLFRKSSSPYCSVRNGSQSLNLSMVRKSAGRSMLWRGGYVPADRAWDYYIIGHDGNRYRYLYLLVTGPENFRIGTRGDFGATYSRCNLSRRKRRIAKECRLLALPRRLRERKQLLPI
jgi:hypothetical protein